MHFEYEISIITKMHFTQYVILINKTLIHLINNNMHFYIKKDFMYIEIQCIVSGINNEHKWVDGLE